jgi:hypothetical protein
LVVYEKGDVGRSENALMSVLTDGVDARADDVEIMKSQLAAAATADAGGELLIEVDVGGIAVLGEDNDRLKGPTGR